MQLTDELIISSHHCLIDGHFDLIVILLSKIETDVTTV